jgi:hypothetical protein
MTNYLTTTILLTEACTGNCGKCWQQHKVDKDYLNPIYQKLGITQIPQGTKSNFKNRVIPKDELLRDVDLYESAIKPGHWVRDAYGKNGIRFQPWG